MVVYGYIVRATREISRDKRPWNKAQAVFLCAMREFAGLRSETFDIRLVSTWSRVSANSAPTGCLPVLSQLATITIGATWALSRERFKIFAPNVDVELQTLLDDA